MPFVEGPIRTMLANMSPTWLSREWGQKFVIGLMGYAGDALQEAATLALKSSWIREPTCPDDALPLIGDEENIPQYPAETTNSYRARLTDPFATWGDAGTVAMLTEQFAALGLTIRIYTDADWARPPTPWWSQFWIVLDEPSGFTAGPIADARYHCGDGTIAGDGAICGEGLHTCGDGSLCGVTGDISTINAMRGIVNRFKAGEEICREAIAEVGALCGDGHDCDDGTECGGGHASISML